MDFSKNFEARGLTPGKAVSADPTRFRGHRGGVISMHRALAHFHLGPMNLLAATSLFLFFSSVWLFLLARVCRFWQSVLEAGLRYLPLRAELALSEHRITPALRFDVPYFRMEPVLPTPAMWWLTCAVTVLLFAATFFLSKKWIPVVYLLRAVLLVQVSALLYFMLMPARFPHTPESYLEGLTSSGAALITAVPLLFGLVYYIFDFGLLKKAALTSLTMLYLTLFLPFQILLQSVILQKTVLFMPLLYIVFGMPLDILLIIAFYSWGMTWEFRKRGS